MTKTLVLEDIIEPDQLASSIANQYITWEGFRRQKTAEWEEIQRYIFATDTTMTSNAKLPWSNKTTVPKLCQIRDNLYSNYMASMFPKRKWLVWEGNEPADEELEKKKTIEAYMSWASDRNEFYDEASKLVLDYIDYGNVFATVDWIDTRNKDKLLPDAGYVGPTIRRISPYDIVFDPTATNFASAPKIIRSFISIGEVKEMIERMTLDDDEREYLDKLYTYMVEHRNSVSTFDGNVSHKDAIYEISGFNSYRDYILSNTVEVLTFYGDTYNAETGAFKRNQVVKIVDRHKVLTEKDNSSIFGSAPIYHAAWRGRPDNLWGMGPLDNLVGMQYRIDHLENLKADVFDIIAYPPLKITGYVEDFDWGPMERIYVGDSGNVDMLVPDVQVLQANTEIAILEAKMEEMAGSPKEAMGFRTPGEKTKYEVQRLENAASRIYQNKISHFERQIIENLMNAELELARRHLDKITIRIFDNEARITNFQEVSAADITGNGRLRPVAARHFAERAEMIQNLTNFYNSAIGADPEIRAHFSSVKIARLLQDLLEVEDYELVEPYIRISEKADYARMSNAADEQVQIESMTPAGVDPADYDETNF
jgi:hypothetical protein